MTHTPLKNFSGLMTSRAAFLLAFSICLLFGANAAQAQTCPAAADYRFQNTRSSTVGGAPALTDIGAGNTFAADTVDGATRTVLQFPAGNGLQLQPTAPTIASDAYTIVALFKFANVNGYRRVIDFKNSASESGLYVFNGNLTFYIGSPAIIGSGAPIAPNADVQVVLTRTAAGVVTGYVNGVEQFTFTDTGSDAVISPDVLRFFKDNGNGEESAGSVARIRLFNCPLTAVEVGVLNRTELSATYTVNSTDDTTDAAIDGVCETATGNGVCTLRAAIEEANATAVADNISFNIAGIGVQTITLNGRLPDISNVVTIDGYTQPGATANTLAVGNNAALRIQITAATNIDRFFTTIGGGVTLRGLVINGYNSTGVALFFSDSNIIEGCLIGTNADGTARGSLANQGVGISISVGSPNAVGTLVGGTTPASRNLISGNGTSGVNAFGGHTVQNNYIGTNAAGTGVIPNGPATIGVRASTGALIGGAGANLRNVISGNNGFGIELSSNNVTRPVFVLGNYIGTAADGVTPLGNGGDGIMLSVSAGNQIGNGTAAGANVIANNGGAGILNANSSNGFAVGNRISVNSIYNNGGLGIDLSNIGTSDGVTPNDAGDADTGTNNLQNFPVITAVTAGSTRVRGTLNSTPSRMFRLEFFSVGAADASGFGEGQTFIGTTNVTTDANGEAAFDQIFAPNTPLGQFVAATATDLTTGDTSEFSQARQVLAPTAAAVSISGRVTTPFGSGLTNARVTLTDSSGNSQTILTRKSGGFRFTEVAAGETYIFSVDSKHYTYAPRLVSANGDITDVNFAPTQ